MFSRIALTGLVCLAYSLLYGQQAFTNTNDSIAFYKADEAFHLANTNSDSALLIAKQSL